MPMHVDFMPDNLHWNLMNKIVDVYRFVLDTIVMETVALRFCDAFKITITRNISKKYERWALFLRLIYNDLLC